MTERAYIRDDLAYASPLNWEMRAGRLFIETEDGEMENAFADPGNRATREEVTQLLHEHFPVSPRDILTPELFDSLQQSVSPSRRDYRRTIATLVDTVGEIPEVDTRDTTITEDGFLWASTQNYDEKGLALVILDDSTGGVARHRTSETLQELANRLPSIFKEASASAETSEEQALIGLLKVLETIGTVDTHAHLQVRVARSNGRIPLSRHYAGLDAKLLFIPETILPTSLGEERVLGDFEQVLFREVLSEEDGVLIPVSFPPEVVEMMEDVISSINDDISHSVGPKMSKAQLIRLGLSTFLANPDAVEMTGASNQEILAASSGNVQESTVNIEKELYHQLYDFVDDHPELGERPVTRMAVAAITALIAERLGREPWLPAATPIKEKSVLWTHIEQTETLSDVDL
jgi:hypothetical protein